MSSLSSSNYMIDIDCIYIVHVYSASSVKICRELKMVFKYSIVI